jgi:lipopolysaccharide biosynthesis regulator YciM
MTRRLALLAFVAVLPMRSVAGQDDVGRVPQLIATGRLAEAERSARDGGPRGLVLLGDILVLRGRLAEADSVYRDAGRLGGADAQRALVGRAELAARRGDRTSAEQLAASVIGTYERRSGERSAAERIAVARAHLVRGSDDADAVRRALALLDEAAALAPIDPEPVLRAADLLLDKYNAPDAEASYQEVLGRDSTNAQARLGLGRVLAFGGKPGALEAARAALQVNPALVPAELFLARLHLEAEAYDSATAAVGRALAVDSTAIPAWATLAAIAWLRADTAAWRAAERQALRINPATSDFYAELAEAAARHRRYADAAAFAAQGTALDRRAPRALGVLGTNQLRIGQIEAARRSLAEAFVLDPFNLWHKNTLDLLDALQGFRTVTSARFALVLPAAEADLLALYLLPLLESAYDSLAVRYGYRPPTPIRLEVYDRHADFSVRTVGLAGIGALGVSFGTVLAMDAPSARPVGEFNYASTAWHELAHTFTLGLSDNRVPRWFSEGLSVLEERRTGRGWGMDVSLAFLETVAAGKLLPVSRINEGLVRPTYPAQIGDSYLQASLVCEMIEGELGAAALPAMLRGFAQGWDLGTVLQRVAKWTAAELDQRFDRWLRQRYAVPLAAIGQGGAANPIRKAVQEGSALLAAGQFEAGVARLTEAERLFPGHAGADGPVWPLARHYATLRRDAEAAPLLARITARGETALEPNLLEATVLERLGNAAGAAAAMQRAVWIAPQVIGHHERLARLADEAGRFPLAVQERRAVLALRPPNVLEARYQLARALMRAGDRPAARREVLAILEEAPGFEKAQELLLDLQGGR